MFKNVRQDICRYTVTDDEIKGVPGLLNILLFNYSLWVILSYRFGRWVRVDLKIPVVKQILQVLTKFSHSILGLFTGIQIPFETLIGPGLYIGHTGTIVINSSTVIGDNCTVAVGVVIGFGGRGKNSGSPVIGNRVFMGVGAKILGRITVGSDVAIGANSVVTKDIPDKATVVGVPGRIVNYLGSADFIKF